MITFSLNTTIADLKATLPVYKKKPTSDIGREWLSEAWLSSLKGKTGESMNVDAFGYTCELRRKTKLTKPEADKPLLNTEEVKMGGYGVAETFASCADENVDIFLESTEVKTLVDEFVEVQEMLLIEEGVNLWKILSLARVGNRKATNRLRTLVSEQSIGALIEDIFRNKQCLLTLEEVLS